MRKSHFTEGQIIGILYEQERGLKTAEGLQEARDQPQYVSNGSQSSASWTSQTPAMCEIASERRRFGYRRIGQVLER